MALLGLFYKNKNAIVNLYLKKEKINNKKI